MNQQEAKSYVAISVALACADIATKYFISHIISKPRFIPGVFGLTDHKNFGLVADLGVPKILILFFTGLLILGMLYVLFVKSQKLSRLQGIALCLIIGGALGNFTDRLIHGFVYDWILLFETSIINLADILIAVGMGLLILDSLRKKKQIAVDTPQDQA